jgi:hypothetical protein
VTTVENVGRAMIAVADAGYPKRVLENPDINASAARADDAPSGSATMVDRDRELRLPDNVVLNRTDRDAAPSSTRTLATDAPVTRHAICRAVLLVLSSVILAACKEATAPTTGTIALNVSTTGVDLAPGGLVLSVDGAPGQTIPVNGTASWVGGEGAHSLAITGLAFNCDLSAVPGSVNVTLGETTTLDVHVSCAPYLRNAIVYTSEAFGFGEVMVMRADGSRQQRLTTDQAVYASPSVSPDGQLIAVGSRLGGSWGGIYLLDRFGRQRTKLVGNSNFDGSPAWSPDGTKLAFRSELPGPSGNYGRIWIVSRDGSNLRQLTPETTDYTYDDGPSWSPDGSQIVYSHNGVLTVINVDGTAPTSLGINGMYPAWSPDGTRIAYYWYAGNVTAAYVADRNGANARQLISPTEGDQYPQWSPDGRQLTFDRIEGGVFHVYKMAADGTAITKLSRVPQNELRARWSPIF